jgi:hypothetical protein
MSPSSGRLGDAELARLRARGERATVMGD